MAKVKAKLTEKQRQSIQNKAHRDLVQHRANWELFQKDIEALGNPSDYKNKQNYKNKVNALRSKHGVTWLRDLKSYNEQFKKRDAELLAKVSNRYVGTKVNRAGELLIGAGDMSLGSRIQPKFSKESGSGYKINPNYIEGYDPTSEVSLTKEDEKKEALRIQKLEEQDLLRGTMSDYEMKHAEQGTFGPSPTWGIGNGFDLKITTNDPNDAPTVNERYDQTFDNPLDDPDYNPQTTKANKDRLRMETAGQSMRTMEERTKAIERAYGPLSKDAKRKLRLRPITQLELEAM